MTSWPLSTSTLTSFSTSTPGSSTRTTASSPSLAISAAGLKPVNTPCFTQRSISQAGRAHNVTWLIVQSPPFVVTGTTPVRYPIELESTALMFQQRVRRQRTGSHLVDGDGEHSVMGASHEATFRQYPLLSLCDMRSTSSVVVVGHGMVGHRFVEALRSR